MESQYAILKALAESPGTVADLRSRCPQYTWVSLANLLAGGLIERDNFGEYRLANPVLEVAA